MQTSFFFNTTVKDNSGRIPRKKIINKMPVPLGSTPPAKHKNARRFLVVINWYGEVHEIWKHARPKDPVKARRQALALAIRELSKKVGYNCYRVYLYVTDPNYQRYEVREI